MAKIVKPPVGKQVECSSCQSTIEYLPEDVQEFHRTDMGGGPGGYERVKCPRPRCPGHGYVRKW